MGRFTHLEFRDTNFKDLRKLNTYAHKLNILNTDRKNSNFEWFLGIAKAFDDKTEFNQELVEKCKVWFKVRYMFFP